MVTNTMQRDKKTKNDNDWKTKKARYIKISTG